MIVLNYGEWKDITRLDQFYSESEQREIYNIYLKMKEDHKRHVEETGGISNCSCDICIEAMEVYKGFKKYDEYYYKGQRVYIRSFNPLSSSADIFVSGKGNGFCEWLTAEKANKELVKELEKITQ